MDNRDLFRQAADVLEHGQPVSLVTVISTTGSTPGKTGSKMLAFGAAPVSAGTVGGGRVEAVAIEAARQLLGTPACRVLSFDLGKSPDDDDGICGGTLELLVESFDATDVELFRSLAESAAQEHDCLIVSLCSVTERPFKRVLSRQDVAATIGSLDRGSVCLPDLDAVAENLLLDGCGGATIPVGETRVFLEPLSGAPTLILCGAGHLAQHVARCASAVGFRIVVCDDRAEFANPSRFPDAAEVVVSDFARAFDRIRMGRLAYIVIVTRGHRCDEIVLEKALKTKARYVGMIGSRQKTAAVLHRLRERGVAGEELERVFAPVGLSIGARTAEEIALSIVSELVKVRRLGDAAPIAHLSLLPRDRHA